MQISNLLNVGLGGSDQALSSAKNPVAAAVVVSDNPAPATAASQDTNNFEKVLTREVSAQNGSDQTEKTQDHENDD
jgi:hypothetical protein